MTDKEFEETIPLEVKDRVARMTDQEAEIRFEELRGKLGIENPRLLGSEPPKPSEESQLAEHEEYFLLGKRLGHF